MPSLPNLDLHKSGDGVSVNRPDPRNKGAFPLISYLSNEELSDLWKNWGNFFYIMTHKEHKCTGLF